MRSIHSAAIVSPKAEIGENVRIGPYAVVEDNVIIRDNAIVHSHAVIAGLTTIGESCEIFPGAVVGTRCQDLKYRGEKTYVEIGARTVIRECVTVNSSTGEGSKTSIGEDCFLMAYSHVGHNCRLGNGVIMANVASLAGHILIEDQAVIGGLVGIHQFVHVGTLSMIGGLSKVNQDVPPYSLSDGVPCSVVDINAIGLRRHGFPPEARSLIRRAFKILFKSGLATSHAVEIVTSELPQTPEIRHLLEFIANSERGIGR
ncbi:MAG: acyl-ACP--UDP-N-acetylglucosamine O-acyltransferase [bacterium]|nr:acyl-ACP--UDP-N-acetylglucosamine O-acyltransferase [bacterium]